MKRTTLPALFTILGASVLYAAQPRPGPSTGLAADGIFLNGKIATVDANFRAVQAVAVRDGKVVAVGSNDKIGKLRGPGTTAVDLKGKTVLPGFIDTHLHVRQDPYTINLEEVTSLAALKQLIRTQAGKTAARGWIRGMAWSEDKFAEKRRPTRWDLDEAAPDTPVYLRRAGGHSGVANSFALELAGISRDTRDPEGGIIEHDDRGEPTGILRERAQALATRLIPPLTEDDRRKAILENLRGQLRLGITSLIDAGVEPGDVRLFQDVYDRRGAELPRTVLQIYARTEGTSDEIVSYLRALPFRTGFGDDRLKIGALKVLVDGGYTGAGAYTLRPYPGRPDYYGSLMVPEDKLTTLVREASALGWQTGFHTIGDAAIKLCADVYAKVLDEHPRQNHRLYVNHFTVMPPEETLQTLARYHILVAQQPVFTYTLAGRYRDNLEGERLARNNPLRTLLDHHIHLALGNDSLPDGPLLCIYAAVTRRGMDGVMYGPEEKLSVEEAVRGFTRDAAYVSFDEDRKGSLEPGKLADMVVLSEDIFTIEPERIKDIQIERTVVGGRTVWESKRASRTPD